MHCKTHTLVLLKHNSVVFRRKQCGVSGSGGTRGGGGGNKDTSLNTAHNTTRLNQGNYITI